MDNEDICFALESLQISKSTIVNGRFGETYIIDKVTGQKYIKGSQRPDGTFRKDIKINPKYELLEEKPLYIPRYRRDSNVAPAKYVKSSQKRDIKFKRNEIRAGKRSGSAANDAPKDLSKNPKEKEQSPLATGPSSSENNAVKKIENSIRNTQRKLREIRKLQSRLTKGDKLTKAQISKIDRKGSLEEKLETLKLTAKERPDSNAS